jgi:hypothetical protein
MLDAKDEFSLGLPLTFANASAKAILDASIATRLSSLGNCYLRMRNSGKNPIDISGFGVCCRKRLRKTFTTIREHRPGGAEREEY